MKTAFLPEFLSRKRITIWWRWAVFFFCIFFIIKDLRAKDAAEWQLIAQSLAQHKWLLLGLLIFLPLNWTLEALKWKILVRKLERITLPEALKGVLTGVVFSFISPQTIGDYTGRFLHLQTASRLNSAGALLVGNFAQLWVTLCCGTWGYWYFLKNYTQNSALIINGLFWVLLLANLLILFFYFNVSWLYKLVARVVLLQKFLPYLEIMSQYRAPELTRVLVYALLRYGIFTGQFMAALAILEVNLPLGVLLNGIVIIFLVKSVIPTLSAFGDLGLREFSALVFFKHFTIATEKVIAASLLLWLINILLPALVGLYFIFKIKIKPAKTR